MNIQASDLPTLRRGIRDLVAMTALPTIWAGSQPEDIAESLADVLMTALHLDLIYICLTRLPDGQPVELVRTADALLTGQEARQTGEIFAPWLSPDAGDQIHTTAHPFTSAPVQFAVIPVGHAGSEGFVVAGARSLDYFTEIDHLLLNVAANQAVTALQQSKLLADLRAANELKDALLAKEQMARTHAQRTAARLALLQDLTSGLSQALTTEQVAHTILKAGTALFGSDGGAMYVVTPDGQAVRMLDHLNLKEAQRARMAYVPLADHLPVTDAIRTRRTIWVENLDSFASHYPELEHTFPLVDIQAAAVVPFVHKNQVLGCLKLIFEGPRSMAEEDASLLSAVAHHCVQALERARLSEQARIAAAAEERQRLARDLHDAVSQVLFSAMMIAEVLSRTWQRDSEQTMQQLDQLAVLLRTAVAEMHTLLLELRPETIANSQLNQLLAHLVTVSRGRRQIDAQFKVEGSEEPLPPEVFMTFYRIAQEGITNILKHSGATHFQVYLQHQPGQLSLDIRDNGRGFNVGQAEAGFGLSSMPERADAINADFQIDSIIDKGTHLSVIWQKEGEIREQIAWK